MKKFRIIRTETYEAFMEADSAEEVNIVMKHRPDGFAWRRLDEVTAQEIEECEQNK